MDTRVQLVLGGYLELNNDEQAEFIEEAKRHMENPYLRKSLNESIRRGEVKMVLGPLGETCPCCGR